MSEKPILFSGPMVRAILEGRKTQTRRTVKKPANVPPEDFRDACEWMQRHGKGSALKRGPCDGVQWRLPCPYGAPGDLLYVCERFAPFTADAPYVVFTDGAQKYRDGSIVRPLAKYAPGAFDGIRWSPSIHMPRWASRITLEVTEVRVQRLQEITEEDAIAEGIERGKDFFDCPMWRYYSTPDSEPAWCADDPVTSFRTLWESISGARPGCSWDDDPWVWVVEFRRQA